MQKLSWEDIEQITDKLADKIKKSKFLPDYLIGIATGGLIPLYFLAKKLKINNVFTVSVSSSNKGILPEVALAGKKALLIDDIAESGTSLKKALDLVAINYNGAELKTATLGINKDKCKFYPDFYIVIEQGEWVVFPWEREKFPEYSHDLL